MNIWIELEISFGIAALELNDDMCTKYGVAS